ncbi:hypothetical protein KQX54_005245 [Cotesia glomerata]|uniref:Uncharacterized protein n=1 Tax=Cotesia glomerata TaxID=32391 RepID=A0AAV7IBM5_COTGL|nr:hypothetical protein KQX54_005245 [Cotesia glomerata]
MDTNRRMEAHAQFVQSSSSLSLSLLTLASHENSPVSLNLDCLFSRVRRRGMEVGSWLPLRLIRYRTLSDCISS